jgi:large subunit ribosomal protein L17
MRHAVDHRKLRRNPSHRKALLKNLMNALVLSERIETTVAKAKELRRLADRLITLGKRDTLHARRMVFTMLTNKITTDKLFSGLAGRFATRAGGYTRIVRTGYRVGDGAEMAIIEYLPSEEKAAAPAKGKKAPAKAGAKASPAKKTAEKKPAARKVKADGGGKDVKAPKATRSKSVEKPSPKG